MDVASPESQALSARSAGTGDLDLIASQAERLVEDYPELEYTCPDCEQAIPTNMQVILPKPARHAARLNDVIRCMMPMKLCPWVGRHFRTGMPGIASNMPAPADRQPGDHVCRPCGFIFSPRAITATVLRR